MNKFHAANWVDFKQLPSESNYYVTYVKLRDGSHAKRTAFYDPTNHAKITEVKWDEVSLAEYERFTT